MEDETKPWPLKARMPRMQLPSRMVYSDQAGDTQRKNKVARSKTRTRGVPTQLDTYSLRAFGARSLLSRQGWWGAVPGIRRPGLWRWGDWGCGLPLKL